MSRDFVEDVRGEIAAIGELDALRAAIRAGLDDLLTDLDIRVIENRDHSLVHHRGQHAHTILIHPTSPFISEAPAFSLSGDGARKSIVKIAMPTLRTSIRLPYRRQTLHSSLESSITSSKVTGVIFGPDDLQTTSIESGKGGLWRTQIAPRAFCLWCSALWHCYGCGGSGPGSSAGHRGNGQPGDERRGSCRGHWHHRGNRLPSVAPKRHRQKKNASA